jgi:Tol biopolymer transport system component
MFVNDNGDVAVRDLTTGQNRNITNNGQTGFSQFAITRQLAISPVPSPDGRRVAYGWNNSKNELELRVIGMDGGPFRILYSNPEIKWLEPSDWSPDGRFVLTKFRIDQTYHIALISTVDGSLRILKTLDWRGPRGMGLSPDGKYVVYDMRQNDSTEKRDVYVLAADGSSDNVLVKHLADDRAIGWSPDGRYVLFSSDRTGTVSYWLVRVANGKPVGGPVLVRREGDPWARPLGFTSDGAVMFGRNHSTPEMHVATIEPTTGKLQGQPTRLIDNLVGSNGGLEWSPDGSEFSYVHWEIPDHPLIVRSLATGIEHVVPDKLHRPSTAYWTPDGRGLVARARDVNGRFAHFLVDVATGEPTMMLEGQQNHFGGWADAGKSFVYHFYDGATRTIAIVRKDVASGDTSGIFRYTVGEGKVLHAFGLNGARTSPDGRSVAFLLRTDTSRSTLRIVPAGGGESRELIRSPVGQDISDFTWSADGRHIFFVLGPALPSPSDSTPNRVLRISAAGGAPEETGIAMEGLGRVRAHPDGRHIAFEGGHGSPGEVWVMENFLPKAEGAKKHSR